MKPSIYSLSTQDWMTIFTDQGFAERSLPYWLKGLYKNVPLWERHVAMQAIDYFKNHYDFFLPLLGKILESADGTIKFQMVLRDQLEVETVLLPYYHKYTVCLSTQVGCAMNCSFCFTGTQGLKRNLSAGEIVGQYIKAYSWLKNKDPNAKLPNIVFMGQGEPLHNLAEVRKAIEVLNDRTLIGVSYRQMTLSTVGYLPGLEQLATFPNINIALSLHSPFDEQREKLIPLNKIYPLDKILRILDQLPLLKNQFIIFEYLLIDEFNMSDEHVDALARLLTHRKAVLNLIPFNPFPGASWRRPEKEKIEEFRLKLVAKKLRVMVRQTKGDDILAACGQLKINEMARTYVR
jgi:23S rRNA (adenine2503-C2)-methyltransferase